MNALDNNYKKIYNIGIYLRLSREDETAGQSESIGNQKDFLTGYAIENGFNIIDYYIDDGYSGTNFDRPAFKKMIEDIEKGVINAVITKDLSRLGRDYIETGHYLERYFPSKKVRYIAVNDGIDTYKENDNDMTPFKAVINDMYAKDISKKVRTAITTKKLKGEFIGSVAPYGYMKDKENKHQLIVDVETAPIVKRIFSMFIENPSVIGVAKQLTIEKIPTPSESKKLTATQKQYKGLWNDVIIKRILTNPTYIGNLTQNRSKKVNYKINKQHSISKENWITIKNTHEPIISKEDFDTVQKLISKRTYIKQQESTSKHILSGLIICADCQKSMTFSRDKRGSNRTYIVCSSRKKFGKLHLCTPKCIREDYVETQVIKKLKELSERYLNKEALLNNVDTNKHKELITEAENEHKAMEKQLEEIKLIISNLYKDKVRGTISEEDFINLSKEFHTQREELTAKQNKLNNEIKNIKETETTNIIDEEFLKEFLTLEKIDRVMLVYLVKKIEIHSDKNIVITPNFLEP